MTDEVRAVEFVAEVRQVKSMADGTVNLTLNLPEYCIDQATWFLKHRGEMVHTVSEVILNDKSMKANESQSTGQNY